MLRGLAGFETLLANDRKPGELRIARYHGVLAIRWKREDGVWMQVMVGPDGFVSEARGDDEGGPQPRIRPRRAEARLHVSQAMIAAADPTRKEQKVARPVKPGRLRLPA